MHLRRTDSQWFASGLELRKLTAVLPNKCDSGRARRRNESTRAAVNACSGTRENGCVLHAALVAIHPSSAYASRPGTFAAAHGTKLRTGQERCSQVLFAEKQFKSL